MFPADLFDILTNIFYFNLIRLIENNIDVMKEICLALAHVYNNLEKFGKVLCFPRFIFLLSTDVTISYELVINMTFNATLEKKDSEKYNTTCAKYGTIVRANSTHANVN